MGARQLSGAERLRNARFWKLVNKQGDGTVIHTAQVCYHPATPVFLEDGGLLCFGYRSSDTVLRRLSADGRVVWEDASLPASALLNLDVDGHLTYVAVIDDAHSEVRSMQTNMRPARGHWGETNAFTRYVRVR